MCIRDRLIPSDEGTVLPKQLSWIYNFNKLTSGNHKNYFMVLFFTIICYFCNISSDPKVILSLKEDVRDRYMCEYKVYFHTQLKWWLFLFFSVCQPLFLGRLLDYFTPGTRTSKNSAYYYAGALIVCSFINILITHPYMLAVLHTGMKIRVGCCSLIYRKVSIKKAVCCWAVIAGRLITVFYNT